MATAICSASPAVLQWAATSAPAASIFPGISFLNHWAALGATVLSDSSTTGLSAIILVPGHVNPAVPRTVRNAQVRLNVMIAVALPVCRTLTFTIRKRTGIQNPPTTCAAGDCDFAPCPAATDMFAVSICIPANVTVTSCLTGFNEKDSFTVVGGDQLSVSVASDALLTFGLGQILFSCELG